MPCAWQAIAEACLARLGGTSADLPEQWRDFGGGRDLESMVVRFLHPRDGRAVAMREETDFELVIGSRTLRVTERRLKPTIGRGRSVLEEDL